MYRNSGEWTLGSWMEKWFVCVQISVPSAAMTDEEEPFLGFFQSPHLNNGVWTNRI